MYQEGLVSVIIPTYRRSEKLLRAIESVINQTYRQLEVFVVSDNEPEDQYTEELKQKLAQITDQRVTLIIQPRHTNGAAARNAGIRRARGEYIAFLDDDDYWALNKLERQVEVIKQLDSSYGAVSTLYQVFLGDRMIGASKPYRDGSICEDILLRRTDVTTCSILIRRRTLDETGTFDETLSRHQEIQLLAFLSFQYNIHLIPEYLLFVDGWGENNPNSQTLHAVKKDFFHSVQPILDKMPRKRKNRIYTMHQFELAYVQWKEKKYWAALKNGIAICKSPWTFYYAIERIIQKLEMRVPRG